MENDLQKAANKKLILCLFEQLSGLKINFHKSELFCFGIAKENEDQYRQLFGCEAGTLPFTYLGIPIHHRKLTNKELKIIEDSLKKLSSWKGKLMSYGTYIHAIFAFCLENLSLFLNQNLQAHTPFYDVALSFLQIVVELSGEVNRE